MQLLVAVINSPEKLDDILSGFLELGITGATVIDSEGMGRVLSHDIPIFAGLQTLMSRSRPENRTVTVWMNDGGRPPSVAPAQVAVHLEDILLGTATVSTGFKAYSFSIPADLAARAAPADPPRLKLVSNLWNPHRALGTGDTRDLGVMVDRVQVH